MTTTAKFDLLRSAAAAALLGLPLVASPAVAQQTQDDQGAEQQQAPTAGEAEMPAQTGAETGMQATGDQPALGAGPDTLIATVGEAEIRGSDLMTAIGALPPQLRSQPPEMLVPMALDQLVLRELILQEARAQNLGEDPEVQTLAQGPAETAQDDAMVQVWLNRELGQRVTDEAVQQFYDDLQPGEGEEVPALEQIRPQIEQHLRRQALADIRTTLQQGADVTLYGPGGEELQPQTAGGMQAEPAGDQPEAATGQSGDDQAGDQPQDQEGAESTGDN